MLSVHDGIRDLPRTIDSILTQKGVDLELIAVDDGSHDGSGALLDERSRRDSRIKVLHHGHSGLTRSLIRGCAAARGEYIARQDVGDTSAPDRLRLQLEVLEAALNLSFVSCWTAYCGPRGEPLYVARGSGEARAPVDIWTDREEQPLLDGPTHHASTMFRRQAYLTVGGYREEFYFGQDWDLWYRLSEVGRFQMIEEALYTARVHPQGISSVHRSPQQEIAKLQLAAARLRRQGLSDSPVLDRARAIRPTASERPSRRQLSSGYYFIASCLIENRDSTAWPYVKQTVTLNPIAPRSWILLARALKQRWLPPHQPRSTNLDGPEGL